MTQNYDFDAHAALIARMDAVSPHEANMRAGDEGPKGYADRLAAQNDQPQSRTISFEMTWTYAAQIIAAALQDGTGEGRDAARAELFRMAGILDELRKQPAEDPALFLHEVITSDPERRLPDFGVAFATEAEASAYIERMERHGYATTPLPAHSAQSLADALQTAADYYTDDRLPIVQEDAA